MPFMLPNMAPHSISYVMRGCVIHVNQYGHTVYHPDFTSNSQLVLTMGLPIFISRLKTSNPVHSTFPHNCLTVKTLSNCCSQSILTSSKAHNLGIKYVYILHYFLLFLFQSVKLSTFAGDILPNKILSKKVIRKEG